jgi:hypothetical protein
MNHGDIKLMIDRLNQYDTGDEYQPVVESAVDMLEQLGNEVSRLSALCDKWNFECDAMREDNKRLAEERYELQKVLWKTRDSMWCVNNQLMTANLSGVLVNAISKIDGVLG